MTKHRAALSREGLERRYGRFYASSERQALSEAYIPQPLHPLIHYAELWGIADDLARERLVMSAPEVAREDLVGLVDAFEADLDEWLGGPEADSTNPSDEYVAFSAMRMARDFV